MVEQQEAIANGLRHEYRVYGRFPQTFVAVDDYIQHVTDESERDYEKRKVEQYYASIRSAGDATNQVATISVETCGSARKYQW